MLLVSEHFSGKYRVGAILWIENKLKINKHVKELSVSAYIKLKALKTWKSLKVEKTLK